MIQFACPRCGRGFKAKAEHSGKRSRCLTCGEIFEIPAVSEHFSEPPSAIPPPVFPPPQTFSERDAINRVVPREYRQLLMPSEKAFHFEWMDTTGGCGTTQSAKQFMLITNQRVLYEATVKEGDGVNLNYVRTSGSIPISKISFVGTSSATNTAGCNPQQQAHLLKVNSGGGNIEFPFFSEEKAKRVQRVIEELISS